MAITNSTQGSNDKALAVLVCSADITGGIHRQLIFLSVLNSFLSITAFLGNTLILVALHNVSSLRPPFKLLFRTLATTDLFVGIILQPLFVASWISMVNERWNICIYANIVGFFTAYISCSVSLMILTAISVDRLLALLLGLRYRQVVTLKRTYITITNVWVVSIVITALYFWNYRITLLLGYVGISLCLISSVYSYAKIFFTLRHNRVQGKSDIHEQRPNQTTPLNIARYRKTVYTTLWLQLALVVCYLPYNITAVYITHRALTTSVFLGWTFTRTLVFFNSTLNPILYCWRDRRVKLVVKNTVRRLFFLGHKE